MAAKIDIWNMSLGHLGSAVTIASADEKSAEALALRRVWEVAKDTTLRDYHWPFATKFASLQLIEEDPTDEWQYLYQYPNDCLDLRRIISGIRNDNPDSRIPYIVGQSENKLVIYTDQEDAEIEYTGKCDITALYPADFVMALSLLIAALAAPQITKGDPFKLGERAFLLYQIRVGRALSTAKNEEQREREPDDSFTRSRT